MSKRILAPLLLIWLLAWTLAARAGAPAFALDVARVDDAVDGKVYRIASSASVAAAPAAVWQVLTDYDHLADFVPGLKSARVLSRDGDRVVVVAVHERAPDRIDVNLVSGDMRVYRCSWELTTLPGGGTKLAYTATIAPDFYVPGAIGAHLVRDDIARMMAAVLARAALPGPGR
jgi:ribosome-associated toxin RatA of RatAB toxin-antitoxin module